MRYLLLGLLAISLGCAKNAHPHPGAINDFDSNAADALYDTQNTLEGLSAHTADYPKAIPAINRAREAYNVFKNDYFLWRCTQGVAQLGNTGLPCPQNINITQQKVQADMKNTQDVMSSAQAEVQTEKGAPK